jgi:hypothetical protein
LFEDGNHRQKGEINHQQVDQKGEGLWWFHQMGLHVCSKLVHIPLEHTTLHEQRPKRHKCDDEGGVKSRVDSKHL